MGSNTFILIILSKWKEDLLIYWISKPIYKLSIFSTQIFASSDV